MRLFNYLTEGRSVEIKEDKFISLLDSKYKNAKKIFTDSFTNHDDNLIYRGIRDGEGGALLYTDPKGDERRSPYADTNLYNILLSNLPSWSNFPKRNKSIICSSSIESVGGYGDSGTYIVLPPDNSNIGVCSADDIWYSFNKIKGYYGNLNYFTERIKSLLSLYFNKIEDDDYKKLVNQMDYFDEHLYLDYAKSENEEADEYDQIIIDKDIIKILKFLKYDFKEGDNLLKRIEDMVDPSNNDIKLLKYTSSINLPSKRELWIGEPCLLINMNVRHNIKDILNSGK